MNQSLLRKSRLTKSVGRTYRILVASSLALILPTSLLLAQRAEPVSFSAHSANHAKVQSLTAVQTVPAKPKPNLDDVTQRQERTAHSIILGGALGGLIGGIVGHQVVRYANVDCPNSPGYSCNIPKTRLTPNGVLYGAFLGGVGGALLSLFR
jgi:hypothetical protein